MTGGRFIIPNGRVARLTKRERVAFVSLCVATERGVTYFDVVAFDLDLVRELAENASVTVRGDLSRRKPTSGTTWTTELVARAIEAGDEALTPAAPARRASTTASAPSAPPDESDVPF